MFLNIIYLIIVCYYYIHVSITSIAWMGMTLWLSFDSSELGLVLPLTDICVLAT